tara:strand:+ start:814 stop:2322 length:1509 start_codon:yes stop_codon:yes gene_type:complete
VTDSFLTQRVPDPCILVIIGASGDLARRKLLPAIWQLAQSNRLPKHFALVGLARSTKSVEEFRDQTRSVLNVVANDEDDSVNAFLRKLHYVSGDLSDPETFHRLGNILRKLDEDFGTRGNRCFYCSVPPQAYLQIVERMGAAGLNREYNDQCKGWVRIVVEKPFGHDLESARTLNIALHKVFRERQIFRIDHYLGKETVQNILVFRLANSMFEPLWNRRYLDHVQITAAESVGIEHRAEYYDQTGALRDMIQNHLLQVLCVIAMEPPSTFDSESVRSEKLKVLKSIRPFSVGQVDQVAVRAQYRPGIIADLETSGYLNEGGVASDSRTETFAATEFTIDNWRWQGVPFYVRTGKRLARRVTAVTLQFKQPPHLIFQHENQLEPSRLTIRIQPEEGIALSFSGKLPGRDVQLGSVEMNFSYANAFGGRTPEAYETLIIDSLLGDGTLFASSDWIEKSWELLMPILEAWGATSSTKMPSYSAGSWGPIEAEDLFDRDWRTWINP